MKISTAMSNAGVGSIMSDAWTKFGYHYCCLLSTFVLNNKTTTVKLACSPLPGGRVDLDAPDNETAEEREQRELTQGVRILDIEGEDACVFNTQKHVEFFRNTFEYYLPETDISDWAMSILEITILSTIPFAGKRVNIYTIHHAIHLI